MKTKLGLHIAIIGAIIGAIADMLLLYSPTAAYENMDYAFFVHISPYRILIGQYLGLLGIPLELFSLGIIGQMLSTVPAIQKTILVVLAYFMVVWGLVYHALIALYGILQYYSQTSSTMFDALQTYNLTIKQVFEPLGDILPLIFACLSLLLAQIIYRYPTAYPKYCAWFNPFFIYLLCIAFYCISTPIGNAIMVAAFNLSVLIWLVITAIFAPKRLTNNPDY